MLAQATGVYRERPVSGPLRDFFAFSWVHQLPHRDPAAAAVAVAVAHAPHAIVIEPDASIDLQWIAGAWRIAGPDREPQTELLPAGATVIGFRFKPAAAAAWLGLPASDILNRRLSLEDVWGSKARRLAEPDIAASDVARVAGASGRHVAAAGAVAGADIAALVGALEAALVRRASTMTMRVRDIDVDMRAAFERLSSGAPPGTSLIPWLTTNLALSERTLRRRFDEAFGYGPKTLDRILRFQRFLELARHSPAGPASGAASGAASAASLAAEAGYADQAHLARESRRLAASTPREIASLLRHASASAQLD